MMGNVAQRAACLALINVGVDSFFISKDMYARPGNANLFTSETYLLSI
jgi:hypothetical protein